MAISGELFIGAERVAKRETFRAIDPATNAPLAPAFSDAGVADVDAACRLAVAAFATYGQVDGTVRARLLETIAENILRLGDELLERAHAESGLPLARLTGERGRTVGQLRLFAAEARDGGYLGLRVDPAMPDRKPLPRSDLRQRKIPLGPVAVFGASNFPLAFSVAGGDTAAALAAGCPVVVKGHPAHPGTSELIASAIVAAVRTCGLPSGVFSLLSGTTNALGGALVGHPSIQAVGFTGSRAGGLALMKIAAARPVPIPVYAEMSSVNPVLVLPGALAARADALGKEFVGSLTLGAGQFCTNPGLVFGIDGPDLDRLVAAAAATLGQAPPATMLTPGIHAAYEVGVQKLLKHTGVASVARGVTPTAANCGQGALFVATGAQFLASEDLAHEVFGASSIVVKCTDEGQLQQILERLEGQLTATLHLTDADIALAQRLVPILERKAGRLIANGWPTGVEVSHAMVHGGPFPATSDGRSTSVGTLAIDRFLRPVCYQDFPDALLPGVLRRDELATRPHRFDGVYKGASVHGGGKSQ
jgi:alpha-ketoglutaric semialdehyde dehydrogenase